MRFTPLMLAQLAKYSSLKASDITVEIVREVAGSLGREITDDVAKAFVAVAQAADPGALAVTFIQQKFDDGTVSQLLGATPVVLTRCPHCKQPFVVPS